MPRLRRSDTSAPGITRVRAGRGFSYRGTDGRTITDAAVRARLMALAVPPAWTDVWISPFSNGHILATGVDDAGRRQYLYHPHWRERKDRVKFERALDLAAVLPAARGQVTRSIRSGGTGRERALAIAFRMLDAGSLRIGGEEYAEAYGSHGLCTLLCSHASITGDVVSLKFPGKSGQPWQSTIDDADLATFVRSRKRQGPDVCLLAWRDANSWHNLTPAEINDYVQERTGGDFTAKDFRTLHGTTTASVSLAAHGPEKTKSGRTRAVSEAMREAASVLGNTPAIAKKSYVDPRVLDRYAAGATIDPARPGSAESELVTLLRS